jgi:hypothetical protein
LIQTQWVLDQPRLAEGKFERVGGMLCDFRPNTFFRRLRNPFNLDSLAVCGAPWSAISMREEMKLEVHGLHGISPHNKHKSTSNQLAVMPCCQHVEHTEIDPCPLMTTQDLRLSDRPSGPGKVPDKFVHRKPRNSGLKSPHFGPKIRYVGQGCHLML